MVKSNKSARFKHLKTYNISEMPYALFDRNEFIKRTGLGPGMKILDIGPDNALAVRIARDLESTLAVVVDNRMDALGMHTACIPVLNPVVSASTRQPFKSSTFDLIISYHTMNSTLPADIPEIFNEILRMLKDNRPFTFLVWSLKPANEAQSSHMKLLEILEKLGMVHLHSFDKISRWLETAGFEEITMELVMSSMAVPEDWVRLHVKRLNEILTGFEGQLPPGIEEAVESYREHVGEHGEELLPSIQFTARRGEELSGIDIVK